MPISGQQSTDTPPADPTQTPPPAASLPAGHVAISQEEHNRLQAENRRLRKAQDEAERKREAQEAERQRQAAEEQGDYQKALEQERKQREAAEERLRRASVADALRDEISSRGFSGQKAAALRRMVDAGSVQLDQDGEPNKGQLMAAVDTVMTSYPDLFPAPSGAEEEPEVKPTPRKASAPATPPNSGGAQGDLLTMEEYLSTPANLRLTPEFQKRVERSRHSWPSAVSATSFAHEA